jgi:hypothetical protein
LELTFGVFGVTLEDLGLTMDVLLLTLGMFDSTRLAFGVFKIPWVSRKVILEPIGFILGCSEYPKLIQRGPGWYSVDTLKSNENRCVFIGLRG